MLFAAFSALALGRVVDQPEKFTEEEYWTLWGEFKAQKGVGVYNSLDEHDQRYNIFKKNMEIARKFNQAGEHSFRMGITRFADMTKEEFEGWLKKAGGTRPRPDNSIPRKVFDASKYETTPATQDWRTQNAVTPVKDQGQCGSCWAFSTTGGIEGAHALASGTLSSFSEQELVDCSSAQGNQGCNGGLMDDGFDFVEKYGLCFESAYPYEAADGSCRKSSCKSQVTVTDYTDISAGSTSDLKTACGNEGPISIAVDANYWWQMYTDGIFDKRCNPNSLDHGVLLVGYGSNYWTVKNSWGESWGESGYIRLTGTSANTCGLANSASYPTTN